MSAAAALLAALAVVAVGASLRPRRAPRHVVAHRSGPSARHAALPSRWRRRPPRRPGWTLPAGTDELEVLVQLLDDIGRAVRTGSSVQLAVVAALDRRPGVLHPLAEALDAGRPLGAAVDTALVSPASSGTNARRTDRATRPSGHATLVLHALAIAARSGGPAAAAIDRTSGVLRERRAWRAERSAQAAQARLGATVMTLVPCGFALWSAATSEQVRDVYSGSPVAIALAVLGTGLNAIGWWWMRRVASAGAR